MVLRVVVLLATCALTLAATAEASQQQCPRGSRWNGSRCVRFDVPPNAHINAFNTGWDCDRGYQRSGSGCVRFDVATLANLKRFFHWLAGQPGFKSRLSYSDAEYFNLSEKDTRVATARREATFPTLEQVAHVLATMPP